MPKSLEVVVVERCAEEELPEHLGQQDVHRRCLRALHGAAANSHLWPQGEHSSSLMRRRMVASSADQVDRRVGEDALAELASVRQQCCIVD